MSEHHGSNILIIKDDRLFRYLFERKFKSRGCNARAAKNGEEGLAMMRASKPDLVLLDLIMPVMNGFEVLKEMRADKSLKDIPVVILSVLGQDNDIKEAKKLGAIDYIVKSTLSMDEAMDRIAKHCPSPPPSS